MSALERRRRHPGSRVSWYLVVGAIGFAVDAGTYLLLAGAWGWPAVTARLAAFVPATLVTWALNRNVTFAGSATRRRAMAQYLRYLVVQSGGIAVSFIVFYAVLGRFPALAMVGLALGSGAALLFNFAGSRIFVFRGSAEEPGVHQAIVGGLPRWFVQAAGVAAFGVLSVLLGQDANWDLANYHLYNAYAFVHDRLRVDLAAAGLQSYFNPLLDLPYYWMTMRLPAPGVAFIMGALHGTALLLVAGIAHLVRPQAPPREAWSLAAAGMLGATFLSELGNTMGDNTTALLVLASLALCLRCLPVVVAPGRVGLMALCAAGILMGAATGLKLTNAVYAVGLGGALFLLPVPSRRRGLLVLVFGVGGFAGMTLTSGYWFATMWHEFGNPLFPQFNGLFGAELAAPIGVADTRWRPKAMAEALLFPFVFTVDPRRIGETPLIQLLWPVAYLLFLAWAAIALVGRRGARDKAANEAAASTSPPEVRLLLFFLACSYVVWLVVFSIGRYTVAMELLLPLAVWVLLHRLAQPEKARRFGKVLIVVAVVVSVLPFKTWGHAPFGERSYTVRPPDIAHPASSTVLVLAQPAAWMFAFFPPELAFVSMFQFPESPGYHRRATSILQARGGEVWAIVPAAADTVANTVAKVNELAQHHHLEADGSACAVLQRLMRLSSRYKKLQLRRGDLCQFDFPPGDRRDLAVENGAIAQYWAGQLRSRDLWLDPVSCQLHRAFIGRLPQPYQFCRVNR